MFCILYEMEIVIILPYWEVYLSETTFGRRKKCLAGLTAHRNWLACCCFDNLLRWDAAWERGSIYGYVFD